MPGREGNDPRRRFIPAEETTLADRRDLLVRIRYVGSGHHKLRPGDYRLEPPCDPRAHKDVCDDLRSLLSAEARALFADGVMLGMMSALATKGIPKYVWAVDGNGEVYEAKTRPQTETAYHGYRLSDDDLYMQRYIRREWKRRCSEN